MRYDTALKELEDSVEASHTYEVSISYAAAKSLLCLADMLRQWEILVWPNEREEESA